MKVILLRDVAKIGRRSDVVEIPDGYALNQLIPKQWALPATPANLKKIAAQKASHTAHQHSETERFTTVTATLGAEPLTVSVKEVNEHGHLFKAVHEADIIAAAAKRQLALVASEIQIDTPIKSLGSHSITLKRDGVRAVITIEVIKQ